MQPRQLGRTTLRVSPLCLGTMQWGWTASEQDARATMDAFVEAGGNFLDSADIYSRWVKGNQGGVAEEIIGRWMADRRNRAQIVVATKVRGPMWRGKDDEGLSAAHIKRAAEDSLRRLQVETIDLYQCHWPDESTPIEESLRAFDELIQSGKVRYIGASNYTAPLLREALGVSVERGLPRFETLQPRYNLVHRAEFEAELMAGCAEAAVAVIPYSPLASGFLTGKYRPGIHIDSARRSRVSQHTNDAGYTVLAAVDRVAKAHSTSPAAVALAWLLANPIVAAPIVGANTPAQLADQLAAPTLALAREEIDELESASRGL
ncbi:MAG: aldo/keto reductase [Dehalococcoidia bacterium]|nr:aldo/keto reductase [Dehalococcoidia bacterium]